MHPYAVIYLRNMQLHREALAQNRACDAATHLRVADLAFRDCQRLGIDPFYIGM